MEYETILDDIQLKKLKILKMKYNAEKIQHKNTGISKSEIDQMAGEKGEKKSKKKLNKSYEEDQEEYEEGEEINESDLESKNILIIYLLIYNFKQILDLDSDQSDGDLEDNEEGDSEMEELEDYEGEELEDEEELEDNEFDGSVEDLELNEEKSGDELGKFFYLSKNSKIPFYNSSLEHWKITLIVH